MNVVRGARPGRLVTSGAGKENNRWCQLTSLSGIKGVILAAINVFAAVSVESEPAKHQLDQK